MAILCKSYVSLGLLCGLLLASCSHARVLRKYTNSFRQGTYCSPGSLVVPCISVQDPNAEEAHAYVKFAVDKLNNVWAPLGKRMSLAQKGAIKLYESFVVAGSVNYLTAELHDPSRKPYLLELKVTAQLPTFDNGKPMQKLVLEDFKLTKA